MDDPEQFRLSYSVPAESRAILLESLIGNSLHSSLPAEAKEFAHHVQFEGSSLPCLPINWRFAESAASLKALEAVLINVLISRKYGQGPFPVTIDTDHAQLFFMSSLLIEVNPDPASAIQPTPIRELTEKYSRYFPNRDLHQMVSSPFRKAVTNIYKTKDNRFFHLHGSLNPDPSLEAIGFPSDNKEIQDIESSFVPFMKRIAEKDAETWDNLLGDKYKQAATICLSKEEYASSAQGQVNGKVGLYRVQRQDSRHAAGWWEPSKDTSVERPLAGLKVVDLTRVIAGPAIARGLAELGASIMRVTAPHLPDFSGLHPDLNWGKWNCSLDLRQEEDREKLRRLIQEADVVVNGYRPDALTKYGFGPAEVFSLIKDRKRGIIYIRENCFGWDGPLSHRSGWQPISDAHSGISMGFGRAMGLDEPVTPVFPNSDYCTGIAGTCAILEALVDQSESGGSYVIDTSLNYYNQWLAQSVGEYPKPVWDHVWSQTGHEVFRHYHSMNHTIPRFIQKMKQDGTLLNPRFFEMRESAALGGLVFRTPKAVLRFPPGTVKLGYNVGTRGNGVDESRWPSDLGTEIVSNVSR
ncbi:hypothetical protein FPRO04_10238 [Fusarium proliferatum]|nr:hypothetical protein FPRO04_10238 [Fusarium proliferatum]